MRAFHFSTYLLPRFSFCPLSLLELNDDVLLLILAHFTVPELLQLRATCRRFSHLIEQYRLPLIRTLVTSSVAKQYQISGPLVKVAFSHNPHPYTDYCRRTGFGIQEAQNFFTSLPQGGSLLSLNLSAFPISLPQLLPRLSSLTYSHFLVSDTDDSRRKDESSVNQILHTYLHSNWSNTLTSLHLNLFVPFQETTQPNHTIVGCLNQMPSLKHLFLEFNRFVQPTDAFPGPLLPDSMPILGQIISFSLHNYGSSNTATLLSQLGPNLVFLSLFDVACSIDDYVTFLQGKSPTYGHSLKTVELYLHRNLDRQLFQVSAQCLPSLERYLSFFEPPEVIYRTNPA